MSEIRLPIVQIEWEERNAARRLLREELEPSLTELVQEAQATYDVLRPRAAHVGSVDMGYPLRHQQVHGYDPVSRGPGGVLADYLMVRLDENRHLTLYYNYDSRASYEWEFTYQQPIDEEHYTTTKVKTLSRPSIDSGPFNFEVSRYRYGRPSGHGDMHAGFISSYFTDYADAERHIAVFSEAIEEAVERFA